MSEANKSILDDSSLVVTVTVEQLKEIIHQEMQKAPNRNGHHDGDRLLDAVEASKALSVSPDWLYKHHKTLPFTRKLGPRMLRFSSRGIQAYLSRKTS
ncbi:MAG: hypothetical protein V3T23_13220 [Nitrososphaerales archaeon]